MTKKYYQGNSAVYQMVIDGDSAIVFKMNAPLSITSQTNAWSYQKRYSKVDDAKNSLMNVMRIRSAEDLDKKEISQEKIDQTISSYIHHNMG